MRQVRTVGGGRPWSTALVVTSLTAITQLLGPLRRQPGLAGKRADRAPHRGQVLEGELDLLRWPTVLRLDLGVEPPAEVERILV